MVKVPAVSIVSCWQIVQSLSIGSFNGNKVETSRFVDLTNKTYVTSIFIA